MRILLSLLLAVSLTGCYSLLPRPLPQDALYVDCQGRVTTTPTAGFRLLERGERNVRGIRSDGQADLKASMNNYHPDSSNTWANACLR